MDSAPKALTFLPAWIVVGLLGMTAVALSSGADPWAAAIAGAFRPADLAADAAAAHLFVQRISPYGPQIRTVHVQMTGLPLDQTLPYFPHPPFSLMIGLPMGFLPFGTAAALWFAFSISLLFALAVLLHTAGSDGVRAHIGVLPFWLLLWLWPPVLYNLEKGQWSILIAVLLAASWNAVREGRISSGAVWAGVAASVKVFPAVLGVYFLIRSIPAAGRFVVTAVILAAIPLVWIGFDSSSAFVHESRLNLRYWETFPLVMFSIHGAVARALVGGPWARPFVNAPFAASIIELVIVLLLLGAATWITWLSRRRRIDPGVAFLVWLVLLPMLNPLALGHTGVLLALPVVVLARTLVHVGRAWQQWAWAVSLMLISVPNQTVWSLAGLPTGPVEGLAVAALPAWGTLLLFAVAVSLAHTNFRADGSMAACESAKITASPAAPISVARFAVRDAD